VGPDPAGAPAPAASSHSLPSSAPSTTRRGILPNRCHGPSRGRAALHEFRPGPAETPRNRRPGMPPALGVLVGREQRPGPGKRSENQPEECSAKNLARIRSGGSPFPLAHARLEQIPASVGPENGARTRAALRGLINGRNRRASARATPRAPEPDGLQPGKSSRATEPGPGAGATACSAPRNRG